jgi:hypothetical protein
LNGGSLHSLREHHVDLLERVLTGFQVPHPIETAMKETAAKTAPGLSREFSYSIDLPNPDESNIFDRPHIDASKTCRQLGQAFPELVWRDGDSNAGKIFLTGESQEKPPEVEVSFFCKETRSPFKLTIRLRNAGLIRAEELKDRFIQALPGVCLSKDHFAFMSVDDYHSIPWVNASQRDDQPTPDLPPLNKHSNSPFIELKIPVDRPCVAIFQQGLEILISRPLLEAMAARAGEIRSIPLSKLSEEERLQEIRGARAKEILAATTPAGTDGNSQLPMALLPRDATYLLAQLLEHGLTEVVHFNSYGMALSTKRINVEYFEMRAGPTAGFGGARFSIGLGKEILSLNTRVS